MNLKETLKLEAINRTKERVISCNRSTGSIKFIIKAVEDSNKREEYARAQLESYNRAAYPSLFNHRG